MKLIAKSNVNNTMNAKLIKIEIYFLSLALLFFLQLCKTICFPFDICDGWHFTGWSCSLIVSLTCICCLIACLVIRKRFDKSITGNCGDIQVKVSAIKNKNYEYLTFLTTYIIPMVCFNTSDIRDCIVMAILLIVLGVLFVKTNVYYLNPTLALLKFNIYEATLDGKDYILISKDKIRENDQVRTFTLDQGVKCAKKN